MRPRASNASSSWTILATPLSCVPGELASEPLVCASRLWPLGLSRLHGASSRAASRSYLAGALRSEAVVWEGLEEMHVGGVEVSEGAHVHVLLHSAWSVLPDRVCSRGQYHCIDNW